MDPYHRLDIGATYTLKKKRKFQSSWNFSIYNVYRKNPYFIYFALETPEGVDNGSIQQGNLTPKAYQVSIFPILPSITWNFNFKTMKKLPVFINRLITYILSRRNHVRFTSSRK